MNHRVWKEVINKEVDKIKETYRIGRNFKLES